MASSSSRLRTSAEHASPGTEIGTELRRLGVSLSVGDAQDGGAGNDHIFANRGVDTSVGGDGNDVLWAMARADVTGPGDQVGDTLDGGNGNDVFRTRDGEVDRVTCGAGEDRAFLDGFDVITDATAENPERLVRARRPQGAEPARRRAGGLRGGAGGAQPLRLR